MHWTSAIRLMHWRLNINRLLKNCTPIQRLNIARHPNRPNVLDHILNITDKWVELHGDSACYDDSAIVTGIGRIDGRSYVLIGHQKGRNTKENIAHNFAMPTPHGYGKALRMMKEHYKRKIADGIIHEPLGGAHADPIWTSQQIEYAIIQAIEVSTNLPRE